MEVINKTIELKLRVINAMQQDRNNQLLSHHLNSADVLKRKQALLEFFEKAKVEALKSFENFINVESTKISEDIYAINHDRWVHESAKDQLSLAASTSGLQFIENTISKTQAIAEADLAIGVLAYRVEILTKFFQIMCSNLNPSNSPTLVRCNSKTMLGKPFAPESSEKLAKIFFPLKTIKNWIPHHNFEIFLNSHN